MDILTAILHQRIQHYMDDSTQTKGTTNMFPAAGILVFLLYALLFHELFTNLWGDGGQPRNKAPSNGPGYRPRPHQTGSAKKYANTLDGLWRRMRQATQTLELSGLKQALITKHMEEARQHARQMEAKRDVEKEES